MDALNGPFGIVLKNAEGAVAGILAQLPLVVFALIAFIACLYVARLVRHAVQRALRAQDRALAQMVAQLAYIGVLVLGGLITIWIAVPSVNLVDFFASLGVTGLILGIALKDMLENFVAGLLILWRHPFGLRDLIRSGAYEGRVEEINFRATVVTTYDGIKVFIPNSRVFNEPLENLTSNPARRTLVVFGVEQDAPIDRVRELMLSELARVVGVLKDPAPTVLVAALGDSSIDLHLLYWTAPPTGLAELAIKSEVIERLYSELRGAGIQFPYPIRTIRLAAPSAANGVDANQAVSAGTPRL
jgi:small conductance mechanosensitive channel